MDNEVRLDKWLWAARLFKSRSLAAEACDGGKVHVNGHAAKPHKLVRPGDRVEVSRPGVKRTLRILTVTDKRGSPRSTQELFVNETPDLPSEKAAETFISTFTRSPGGGRPSKRERRDLRKWRGR